MTALITIPGDPPAFSFRRHEPVRATVRPGDRVSFVTDAATYRTMSGPAIDRGDVDFQRVNALSGPLFVTGAEPGDALGFQVEQIDTEDSAAAGYVARWRSKMFGSTESRVVPARLVDRRIQVPGGGDIEARPMIGCIGVAPARGSVSSLSPAARTGGNLDLVEVQVGTTVWLPVEVPGGLLSMGDLHVRMGRGEPLGSGLECAGNATGTVHLARGQVLSGPVVVGPDAISFVGSDDRDRWESDAIAVRSAWTWLREQCGVEPDAATVIAAALLDVNHAGPAGANSVATFNVRELRAAGVRLDTWTLASTVSAS